MNRNLLELPRWLTLQLMHLAQQSPQTEVCGLIAADADGLPCRVYPIANCAEQPHCRYTLDAAQQIAAMQEMREQNLSLFAIYHSHPNSAAEPSPTDIEQAAYPEAIQLIISLSTQGVLELRAFLIQNRQSQELTLRLVE
jgi:[CysO sulfur-carrier protein]-S-L-cysteine hydrolase